LNTAPLVWSFSHGTRRGTVELVDALPARCASLLKEREVKAALAPIIEYQRMADIFLVPDVCVGTMQQVRSVVLATRVENLRNIQRLALDESSRTSATLLKIIFREFLGCEPEWITGIPDVEQMLADNDAALIIGDPAMTFARENLHVFDLAELWRERTGLGFVFAMWMVAEEADREGRIDFSGARDEGVARTEEIVESYTKSLGLSPEELRTYLRENISFSIAEEMRAGMELYFKLAHKHRLIPELKPLKYI
jgi:chorismate dehydratase